MVAIADHVFTKADLLAAAGQRSFERGLGYTDAVTGLVAVGRQITATVHGTDDYFVMLALRGRDGVTGACDCPYGREGFFCKHCVAVGLAYLDSQADPADQKQEAGSDTDDSDSEDSDNAASQGGLASWLSTLDRDALLLLVLEEAVDNEDLRGRLAFRAAVAAADSDAITAHLDTLLDPGDFGAYGYVEEGESLRYARRVATVVDVIEDLVDAGGAAVGQAIAEVALDLVTTTCRDATDPAGVIWDAVACLGQAHLDACVADPPDELELAGFIAARLLISDVPAIEIADYRELLGDEGLALVRELLTNAVAGDPLSWSATGALEDLLRATGDVDALIEHLSANLPATGLGHLKIAAELAAAGRIDQALTWAQDGLRVSRYRQPNIADFLVQHYHRLDRVDEALTVRRDVFAAAPDLASFQRLRDAAARADTWPDTRAWALDLLRADADKARSRLRGAVFSELPAPLIDILIAEGEPDAAWDAAPGLATEGQWLRLADLCTDNRPADALAVYLRQLGQLKDETGDRAYERIARLLVGARACHRRLGTEAAFRSYLRSFRLAHKRKRKLMSILDAHQL